MPEEPCVSLEKHFDALFGALDRRVTELDQARTHATNIAIQAVKDKGDAQATAKQVLSTIVMALIALGSLIVAILALKR